MFNFTGVIPRIIYPQYNLKFSLFYISLVKFLLDSFFVKFLALS